MVGAGLNEQRVCLVQHGGLPDPDRPGHQQDGNHVEEAFHMIRPVAAAPRPSQARLGPGDEDPVRSVQAAHHTPDHIVESDSEPKDA